MKLTPSEQIMYNVSQLTLFDESHKEVATATGFFYGFCYCDKGYVLGLVTNRHVLSKGASVRITMTRARDDGSPDIGNLLEIEADTKQTLYHPNNDIDLAVLPITGIVDRLISTGERIFFKMYTASNIPTSDEWSHLTAVENVLMAGFPKGLRDEVNNQPIIRSGATATHPALNFKGASEFLVDMPCFEGCSGSPVIICNEGLRFDKRSNTISTDTSVKLLGVQCAIPKKYFLGRIATIPTADTKDVPVMPLYLDLGFVIRSSELLIFEDMIKARLAPGILDNT